MCYPVILAGRFSVLSWLWYISVGDRCSRLRHEIRACVGQLCSVRSLTGSPVASIRMREIIVREISPLPPTRCSRDPRQTLRVPFVLRRLFRIAR